MQTMPCFCMRSAVLAKLALFLISLGLVLSVAAQTPLQSGETHYQQGNFQQAIALWEPLLEKPDTALPDQYTLLLRLSQAYKAVGMYAEVFTALNAAMDIADELEDPTKQAAVFTQISDAWLVDGDQENAMLAADQAVELARELNHPALLAHALNALGNVLAVSDYQPLAREHYTESTQLAQQAGETELVATVAVNFFKACLYDEPVVETMAALGRALAAVNVLSEQQAKASAWISLGTLAQYLLNDRELQQHPDKLEAVRGQARQALQNAIALADKLQAPRLQSLAHGRLGQLYEASGQVDDALSLTRQALFFARTGSHPEIQYLWEWQQGRIFYAQAREKDALAAYQAAAATLKPIRYTINVGYRGAHGTFDENVRPVYYELADLLLQLAAKAQGKVDQQEYLKAARDAVETVKMAELEEYFRDECVVRAQARAKGVDETPPNTAVLYPIPLEDRTALLISIGNEIHAVDVPVTGEEVNVTAQELRIRLQARADNRFLQPAQKLYDWLIRPVDKWLAEANIDTLVFVPDGRLRLIPISVLHDGKSFLVERYALAITPGLSLTDPQKLIWQDAKLLLIGLSDAVQGYPPLINVPKELRTIQGYGKATQLLNKEYSLETLRSQLQHGDYSVLHMATHGEFSGNPDETYLLAYEDKITLDKLQEVIGLGQFRKTPIELLTLSACRTAVGDDRSALGLAGVAVKAGARSAMASLWFVDDEATSLIMQDFYNELFTDNTLTKAKALQKVQRKLIGQPRYWHPSYWAPFLLIGNWL